MSNVAKWSLFAGYVVASVCGLALLKNFLPQVTPAVRGISVPSLKVGLGIVFGAALYVLSFFLWLLILRSLPLGIAYPAAVGATLCGTSLVSLLILGEKLRAGQAAGIVLILVGVVLVFRGN